MKKKILNNLLAKKIIGLLLKEAMSISDLANKIYRNRNARSGISNWIEIFLKNGWITKKYINSKSILYKAKIEVLGKFNKDELNFIELVIGRFWSPLTDDPFDSLTNLVVLMLSIKKLSKIKEKINGYNPKKDFELYKANKKQFWEDKKFRDNFLNKVYRKGEKRLDKKDISFHLRRDFIFISMLIPETILNKLDLFKKNLGNPMYVTLIILDEKNANMTK